MRSRNIKKNFWVNKEEDNLLKEKCKMAKMTEAEFLRSVISGYKIKEQPQKEFYDAIKNLRGIAINMNQIARKANAFNYIDIKPYKNVTNQVMDLIVDLKTKYLVNEKES